MAGRKTNASEQSGGGFSLDDAGPEPIDPASISGGNSGGSDGGSIRDALGNQFDSSIHIDPDRRNSDGSFRRKRGRKSGSGNKGTSKIHTNLEGSIEGLTKALAIIHIALANATKAPELIIADEEAKSLASATINVLDLYDIRPDPKIEAIVALIGVSFAIYTPRVIAIKMRKEQEKKERKANANGEDGLGGLYDENGFPLGTTVYAAKPTAN